MPRHDETGKTADAGYQIGVRRTLACAVGELWELLVSREGTRNLLGGPVDIVEGHEFTLDDGTSGKVSVVKPGSHLRTTWQPSGWSAPSHLQVRVLAAKRGTTLAIHQDHLRDADEREAMRAHWRGVIERLAAGLPD